MFNNNRYSMNLNKSLLSAILLGITIQTTSCSTEEEPQPLTEEQTETAEEKIDFSCHACGMG